MPVALDIILQIARGVLHMHESGTAHRDLKPQNVGVSIAPNGTFCVKLLDFGLSKTKVQVSKYQTVSHSSIGTTRYRAPEAFEEAGSKQKVKWFRADVYSFAVMCCEILTLQEPYASVKHAALYKELMKDTRPPLPDDCSGTLSELVKLVKECWAGDFNARPNFWSICERLEKFKHDLLLQGPGAASTEGVDQLRGENVASSSSYAFIETMLKRRSQLRTPAKHLAKVVENEGATSDFDEGNISDGDEGAISEGDEGAISEGDEGTISEGDEGTISEGDEGTISEGDDGAISEGVDEIVDEMEFASGSRVLGDADHWSMREKVRAKVGVGAATLFSPTVSYFISRLVTKMITKNR